VLKAGVDRDVAGHVAAAVARLTQDQVVDELRIEGGAPERLPHHQRAECRRLDVGQRPLVRGADRRPGRGDDGRVTHGH
jgi:hypothetical protein